MLLQLSSGGKIVHPAYPPAAELGIELVHVGRQLSPLENPGSFELLPDPEHPEDQDKQISKDPNATSKLIRLLNLDQDAQRYTYVVVGFNHHRGGLGWIKDGKVCWSSDNKNAEHCTLVTGYRPPNPALEPLQRIIALPLDALVWRDRVCHRVHQTSDPPSVVAYAARTLDCLQISGISGILPFGCHISAETLCGFYTHRDHQLNFRRSILRALFGCGGVDPKEAEVWFSPAVGGMVDPCEDCFEYTETPEQPDGSILLACLREEYPDIDISDLVIKRTQNGKWGFDLGQIVKRILIDAHGVPQDQVHTQENICTRCHAGEWHSDRVDRHDHTEDGERRYIERVGNWTLIAATMKSQSK